MKQRHVFSLTKGLEIRPDSPAFSILLLVFYTIQTESIIICSLGLGACLSVLKVLNL